MTSEPTKAPKESYYAVIFTSKLTGEDLDGYATMGKKMDEMAKEQDGYLGIESTRNPSDRVGITVSYWKTEDAILKWKSNIEHQAAQSMGIEKWYQRYSLRIAKVEREYEFHRSEDKATI